MNCTLWIFIFFSLSILFVDPNTSHCALCAVCIEWISAPKLQLNTTWKNKIIPRGEWFLFAKSNRTHIIHAFISQSNTHIRQSLKHFFNDTVFGCFSFYFVRSFVVIIVVFIFPLVLIRVTRNIWKTIAVWHSNHNNNNAIKKRVANMVFGARNQSTQLPCVSLCVCEVLSCSQCFCIDFCIFWLYHFHWISHWKYIGNNPWIRLNDEFPPRFCFGTLKTSSSTLGAYLLGG